MASPVENVVQLVDLFVEVARGDPLSAPLLLIGALLVGVTVAVAGYLSGGALVSLVTSR